jgi:plasmid stability protein
MRTTLNLDEDVARQLAALARRHGRSLSRVANELLRAGLRAENDGRPVAPYAAPTFDTGRPLVDVTDVAAALEVLERAD